MSRVYRSGFAESLLASIKQNGGALALMVAMTSDPVYRPFSLGKHLFDDGLAGAVRRVCRRMRVAMARAHREAGPLVYSRTAESTA